MDNYVCFTYKTKYYRMFDNHRNDFIIKHEFKNLFIVFDVFDFQIVQEMITNYNKDWLLYNEVIDNYTGDPQLGHGALGIFTQKEAELEKHVDIIKELPTLEAMCYLSNLISK